MIHVEALHGGVGLAGADGLDRCGVVGYAVDAHLFAFDVGVEEAHVHGAVGLDLVAVLVEQGHVDGRSALEGLALVLDLLGHGVDDVLALDRSGLHRRALGQHARGGGDLHEHVAGGGVALERGIAHVGLDLDDVLVLDGVFDIVACSVLSGLDLRVGGYGGGGGVLGRGGFGFRGLGFHFDGEVAGHEVGGDLVLAGLLVGGQLGLGTVDDGLHLVNFIARVGVGGERQLLVQRRVEGREGRFEVLVQVLDVRVLEVQADDGHTGLGDGQVGRGRGRLDGGRGRLALDGCGRLLGRRGRLGVARLSGFGSLVAGGVVQRVLRRGGLGRSVPLRRVRERREVAQGERHHHGHEDGQRLALERVLRVAKFLKHAHTYHRILVGAPIWRRPPFLEVTCIRFAHTFSGMLACVLDVVGRALQ